MTLITAAANFEFVVQVADRRLTGPSGALPDEQTKAIHFHLPDADFLVGYTGLAMAGPEPMHRLLMQVLADAATGASFKLLDTATAIADGLTELFARSKIARYRRQDRRLSMMMTGFHRVDHERHTVIQGFWSNFQEWGVGDSPEAWDLFKFTPLSVKAGEEWPTLIQRIGAYDALRQDRVDREFRPLLASGRPPAAIRDKIIRVLPEQAALHPTIGVNANAAILYPDGTVEWSYWTGSPGWQYSLGNTVWATPDQVLMIADTEVHASTSDGTVDETGRPMVVPQVPKNKPCPCGSGRRYRRCHGERIR